MEKEFKALFINLNSAFLLHTITTKKLQITIKKVLTQLKGCVSIVSIKKTTKKLYHIITCANTG